MTKRLVIDANIVISAGKSEHPISSGCRKFLQEVIAGDFLVVMTNEIEQEWKDPEKPTLTGNSRKWLRRLYGEKKIEWQENTIDSLLRDDIDALKEREYSAKMRLRMLEDVHLLEAALATDRNITSRDEEARKLFNKASTPLGRIQLITWVNPVTEDDCMSWLENGCPVEKRRQLGYMESGE